MLESVIVESQGRQHGRWFTQRVGRLVGPYHCDVTQSAFGDGAMLHRLPLKSGIAIGAMWGGAVWGLYVLGFVLLLNSHMQGIVPSLFGLLFARLHRKSTCMKVGCKCAS